MDQVSIGQFDASLGSKKEHGFHAGGVRQCTDMKEGLHPLGRRVAIVVVEDLDKGSQLRIREVWSLWDFEALRMEIAVESLEKREKSAWFDGLQQRDIVETRGGETGHDYLQTVITFKQSAAPWLRVLETDMLPACASKPSF